MSIIIFNILLKIILKNVGGFSTTGPARSTAVTAEVVAHVVVRCGRYFVCLAEVFGGNLLAF